MLTQHYAMLPQLGLHGQVVEIDESLFVRRKGNVGRSKRQLWVFGLAERGTNRRMFMLVPDRRASTLLPLIQ